MTKLSLVIPCYFNGMNIPETYQVICRDVFSVRTDIDYELIFVDDRNIAYGVHIAKVLSEAIGTEEKTGERDDQEA